MNGVKIIIFYFKGQGPHFTGKIGNTLEKNHVRENRGDLIILYTEVVNSLILKITDIAIFAVNIFFPFEAECVFQACVAYETVEIHWNWQRDNLSLDRENREFENRI